MILLAVLSTIFRSNGHFSPLTHWPPKTGVLQTLGCGCPVNLIGPTRVARSVALSASRMEAWSVGSLARLSVSIATSQSAWEYPSGCVHCFFCELSQASAMSRLVSPVSDDLNGKAGVHHTSELMPSPSLPIASIPDGKSNAAATVTTFGWKPCWLAWVMKVLRSETYVIPPTMSQFSALYFSICA